MKTFNITDRVSSHVTTPIQVANGKSALNKFRRCLISTGIYWAEKNSETGNWHLISSYGSDFEAVPVKEA